MKQAFIEAIKNMGQVANKIDRLKISDKKKTELSKLVMTILRYTETKNETN